MQDKATYLVDRQRGIVSNDGSQRRQKAPRVVASLERGRLLPHVAVPLGRNKGPDENGDPGNGHDDALGHEEPPQLVRVHEQKRHASEPEQEEADHGGRVDALAGWNGVLEGEKRGPDGANHDADRVCAVHVLDGEPEDGENGARDNGQVRAPEAPRGACDDGKRDMVEDTNGAVERNDKRDDEEGEGDDAERFAPSQTWSGGVWLETTTGHGKVGQIPMAMMLDANCHVAALHWR